LQKTKKCELYAQVFVLKLGVPWEVTVEGSPSVSEVLRIWAAKHFAVELWIYDGAVGGFVKRV